MLCEYKLTRTNLNIEKRLSMADIIFGRKKPIYFLKYSYPKLTSAL